MENRGKQVSVRQTERFGSSASQRERFFDALQSFIGPAKKPQRPGRKTRHHHSWVQRVQQSIVEMSFRREQGKCFLKMFYGRSKFANVCERYFHGPVTSQCESRVWESAGQAQKFFRDRACGS